MNEAVNFYGPCPVCGLTLRGPSAATAECGNTNCGSRRVKHGLTVEHPTRHLLSNANRVCSVCSEPLWCSDGASAYCPNDDCERYMREQ